MTAGLICTLLGAGVTLAALGVINYAIPALGHAYLSGDAGAMDIADSFFTWPRGAMIYPAVLVPIGAILFAVAMWRSHAVPSWAAGLFAFSRATGVAELAARIARCGCVADVTLSSVNGVAEGLAG